mmetsp:Transcript_59991/g.193128  ORF Transcript_59991/g.193128 Transcript_59991/m.193128 type:complete len:556 (-) Transcript_59991:194-1861(-)
MCGNCTPCNNDQKPQKASYIPTSPRRPKCKESTHEGQFRATLQVKDGGFGLRNFAATNPGRIEEFFRFESKLGEGGFGTVQRGQDKRTELCRAVKRVRKKDAKEVAKLHEEIEIMRLLDHPNIVRLMESFEDRKYIYLVLELCEGGELFERIVAAGVFTENIASACLKQMFLAINYLHQNHIMHRDLKPENWLLATREDVGKSPLKLIDFGISRRFEPGVPARTKAGTPNYVAPEVLAGRYDEKSDVWSLGVIAYILLAGSLPFSGKRPDDVLQQVKQAKVCLEGKVWRNVSQEAKAFVQACMQKLPSRRPSAEGALQDPWIVASGEDGAGSMTKLELTGIKAFARMHKLKQAAVTIVATQLTDERIETLKNMFMSMDHNSDGTLSVHELKQGLLQAGVACPENLDRLLQETDTDGSGVVDYTEFLAATMDRKLYHQESVVWTAFKKFDLNGSGSIDRQELSKVLGDDGVMKAMHLQAGGVEPAGMEQIFAAVDRNGDGLIDFEEFFAMMRKAEGGGKRRGRQSAPCGFEAVPRGGGGSAIGIAAQGPRERRDSG